MQISPYNLDYSPSLQFPYQMWMAHIIRQNHRACVPQPIPIALLACLHEFLSILILLDNPKIIPSSKYNLPFLE